MPKRKRQSTHDDDDGDSRSESSVTRKRNGNPSPVHAHVLAWLDHCLEFGVAFKETAPDYMKQTTTQTFTWSQLDQRLRLIVKAHNSHPPWTPVLLNQGTRGLQNFDGTQLQIQVNDIRISLPSRSLEPLGEIRPALGFEVVLYSTATNSQHPAGAPNQSHDLVTALPEPSSRAVICPDSESPPSSPKSQPPAQTTHPHDVGKTNDLGGQQPYFVLDDDMWNETAVQQTGVSGQMASKAAQANELVVWQGSQDDQIPNDDDVPSPCSSALSSPPSDIGPRPLMVSPVISTRLGPVFDEINKNLQTLHDSLSSTEEEPNTSDQHCDCGQERDELRRLVSQLEKKVVDIERAQLVHARIDQGILPPSHHDIELDFYHLLAGIDQVCLSLATGDGKSPPLPSVWNQESPLAPLIQRASAASRMSWTTLMCTQAPGRVETLRCLVAASVFMNVFEHSDLGLLGGSCYLLAKYREAVLLKDGAEALRRLDRSVHEGAKEDPIVQSQLETASKSLAGELEEILSSTYQLQAHEDGGQSSTQSRPDTTTSPTCLMFQKVFASALQLKALLLQTGQRYRADFVPTGARFSPDTMSLIGFESMGLWQQQQQKQSQGLAAAAACEAPGAPPRAVKFCVFPAVHAYPLEKEWASKADASAFTVDYCNFVSGEASREDLRLVSKAVVSVFE